MPVEHRPVIAVVDDDQRILVSLKKLFESAGYSVRLYLSVQSFLKGSHLSEIDCLITDVRMPGIDGFELQHRVEEVRPDLPVILITGDHTISSQKYASGHADKNFLRKPFKVQELLSAVRQGLLSSRKIS